MERLMEKDMHRFGWGWVERSGQLPVVGLEHLGDVAVIDEVAGVGADSLGPWSVEEEPQERVLHTLTQASTRV
jgi:hypothetical protein